MYTRRYVLHARRPVPQRVIDGLYWRGRVLSVLIWSAVPAGTLFIVARKIVGTWIFVWSFEHFECWNCTPFSRFSNQEQLQWPMDFDTRSDDFHLWPPSKKRTQRCRLRVRVERVHQIRLEIWTHGSSRSAGCVGAWLTLNVYTEHFTDVTVSANSRWHVHVRCLIDESWRTQLQTASACVRLPALMQSWGGFQIGRHIANWASTF